LTDVVIVGAGNHGALFHDCLVGDDRWRCVCFVDDQKAGGELHGLPIYGRDHPRLTPGTPAFLAVGFPELRKTLAADLEPLQLDWQTYIDRRSVVGCEADLGRGTMVLSFAMIASGVKAGPFCYFSSFSRAGTGTSIGGYVSLMAGASAGACVIGNECVLSLNSTCLDGAHLGDRVTIAPHTLVRRPVPNDSLVAGHPARVFARS